MEAELIPQISNEYLKVSIDKNGLLESISHVDGVKIQVSQNFYYYSQSQRPLQSGAYCFRAEERPVPVTTEKVPHNTIRGALIREIRQRFSDWVTQIIRLYRGEEFVELEWIVGPVPTGTDLGKEVVSIFSTNISNNGEFYTDANGRQMMKRSCWNETTGFMGKVLIEKLLYSCPGVARIYLLMRCKKGVEPEDRIKQLYSSECFDRLRNEKPDVYSSKVSVIPGDVMETNLGISEEHRQLLINNVNVVFHVAASVRFNDPLTFAVKLNLKGTKLVVDLAQEMKQLSSFVHVSTSYSNTNRDPVEELMYPPHADWRDILQICEEGDEFIVRTLTPKLLGDMIPNTYTFTKQLAEHVVYESRGVLPVTIFRPSIVISSFEEPAKGWIDNFNGPVGLLVASGKGIMRSLYSDPDLIADYMPVDIAIRAMIASAWVRGTKSLKPTDDIPIYNCCSGKLNNITNGEIIELGKDVVATVPLNNMLWNTGGSLTTSKTIHYIKVLFLHFLPAILVDLILRTIGRKPMLVKIQRRIYIANLALDFYVTKQWTFDNKNLVSLRSVIKEQDTRAFYYDMENIDQRDFFLNSCLGVKKYLLKEKLEDLPKAKVHMQRMQFLDALVQFLFYGLVFWLFMKLSFIQNLMKFFLSLMQM